VNARTILTLGRVSNLPTVWTNTLAGTALAGAWPLDGRILPLMLAMSLAYVGGMFLNDACDHEIDRLERPERPIPAGTITRVTVLVLSGVMLAASAGIVAWLAYDPDGGGHSAVAASLALIAAIITYDLWHKHNPLSPLLMGLCRLLVYVVAGHTLVASPAPILLIGALVSLGYLIGLTYTAKQESRGHMAQLWPLVMLATPLLFGAIASLFDPRSWLPTLVLAGATLAALSFLRRNQPGDIPLAVALMIAGIALVDAVLLSHAAGLSAALVAGLAFALTVFLQRHIPAT